MTILIVLLFIFFVFALVSIPKIISSRRQSDKGYQNLNKNKMLANRETRAFLFDVTSEDGSTLAAFETAIKNPHLISTDYLADESWAYEY